MDKATDKGKKVGITYTHRNIPVRIKLAMAPEMVEEYHEIVKLLHDDHKRLTAMADKEAKKFFSDQKFWFLIRRDLDSDYSNDNNFWAMLFVIDGLEKRLSNIETIVQGITENISMNLSSLKTEIETLQNTLKQPEISEIGQFIRNYKETIKKKAKAGEEYVE